MIVQKKVTEKLEFMLEKYEKVVKAFKRYFNSDELFRILEDTVNQNQLLSVS